MAEVTRRFGDERSIGEMLGELSQDMALLLRQEARLAKTEMQDKVAQAAANVASLATGAAIALVGGLALTAALILVLIDPVGLKPWMAALAVGVVMGLLGWGLLWRGVSGLKRTDPTPRRTVETIKEDIRRVKEVRP
jgi:uncharacterized membrane protein YqjE